MKLQTISVCVSSVGFAASATLAASLAFTNPAPDNSKVHAAPTAAATGTPSPITPALRADEQLYADSLRGSYPSLAGVSATDIRDRGRTLCAHLLELPYEKGTSGEAGWANLGMIGTATRSDMGLKGVDDWFAAFDLTAKYLCPEIAEVG